MKNEFDFKSVDAEISNFISSGKLVYRKNGCEKNVTEAYSVQTLFSMFCVYNIQDLPIDVLKSEYKINAESETVGINIFLNDIYGFSKNLPKSFNYADVEHLKWCYNFAVENGIMEHTYYKERKELMVKINQDSLTKNNEGVDGYYWVPFSIENISTDELNEGVVFSGSSEKIFVACFYKLSNGLLKAIGDFIRFTDGHIPLIIEPGESTIDVLIYCFSEKPSHDKMLKFWFDRCIRFHMNNEGTPILESPLTKLQNLTAQEIDGFNNQVSMLVGGKLSMN